MIEIEPSFGLNTTPKKLTQKVQLTGKKVDPSSGIPFIKRSTFTIEPVEEEGVSFRVGDIVIPYNADYLHAVDTKLGRMLCLRHPDHDMQIMLVEHLLSAISLVGLTGIQIVLEKNTSGLLTSGSTPLIGMKKPTYWVPVMGPGVEGFVRALLDFSVETGDAPGVIKVTQARTHTVIDSNPKYRNLERMLTIKPADRLIIRILSAEQPDINNCPIPDPITISEGDDVSSFLTARPIMRIRNKFEQSVVFLLNLFGSSMLTHDTYVKSRPKLTPEEIVTRMFSQFREGRNEFLYHAAIADRLGEIGAFTQGRHLHAELIMKNMNHVAHMNALHALLTPYVLGK